MPDDHDTIEWLMVWIRAAGCGNHVPTDPAPFLHRLTAAARHVMDTVLERRISTPELGARLDELNAELARSVILSLPDPLLDRWSDHDPMMRLAVLCAIYIWILHASDALVLPRGNVGIWRYHLAMTQHEALHSLAAA